MTRQGYSDDSAWARGQAWGVYGLPLNYRYTRDESAFNLFEGMTNYFLNRLPEDDVCYWDLIFGDGSGQPRDSSAAAVAVCGIHEMEKYLPEIGSAPRRLLLAFGQGRGRGKYLGRLFLYGSAGAVLEGLEPVLVNGGRHRQSLRAITECNGP